jgi:hypothetical protein
VRVNISLVELAATRFVAVLMVMVAVVVALRKWNWRQHGPSHAHFARSLLQRKRRRYKLEACEVGCLVCDAWVQHYN